MKNSTKLALMIAGVLLLIVGVVGITYAFFRAGGVQETANTFTSGCLNISLTNESTSINLTDAYPITDVEGLNGTSYDFTVTNNCNSAANYQINLESLNEQVNSLSADYIKVSLSSDTVDNVISILGNNTSVTPTIDNAYESYNLYTDTLNGGESKTYHLKIWLDYDATVEVAASKVYSSKINVIANPETTVVDTLEAQFNISSTTVTATLTDNVTSASYCTTADNICTPNTSATISNNSFTVELEEKEEEQVVCTELNGTSKIICSNGMVAEKPTAAEVILAGKNIDSSRSGAITGVLTTNTTGTVYSVEDDDGTSYVYAGAPTDNWVYFAGFYWRIIRINGDGSIRMIYNGTTTDQTGIGTQITVDGANTFRYNQTYGDNTYVGYMTGLENECALTTSCSGTSRTTSYSQATSNAYDSNIKSVLDQWYEENLLENYAIYLSAEAGFCNDRKVYTGISWSGYGTLGYGTNATTYEPASRFLQWSSGSSSIGNSSNPTLECSQSNDLFTLSGSSKGNNALAYPIGLITADEVALAGGSASSVNNNYYLYTNQYYWTMSPHSFYVGGQAYIWYVLPAGNFGAGGLHATYGIRPVINLRDDVTITGSGLATDPYLVS